jgi:hypothetical protein
MVEPTTRRLLVCGLVAPVLFVAGFLAQDALTPGYEPTRQFISHLSLGPYGWVNSVLLVVSGGLVLLFAAGLRRLARRDRRARGLWVPMGVLGGGIVAAGVFAIDPGLGYPPGSTPQSPSWHGTVHDLAGGLVLLATVAGCVMTGRRFTGDRQWRRVVRTSYGAAVAIVLLFALTSVLAGLDYAGAHRPGVAGLAERAYLTTVFGWVLVLARLGVRTAGERRPAAAASARRGDAEPISGGPGSSTARWTW